MTFPNTMHMMQQAALNGTDMTDLYPTDAPLPTQTSPGANLRIEEVHVSNFRNIVDVRISLESGATFLVGENNAGKSSFLLAIAAACGFHRATRDDFHQSDEGTATEAIIDLIIRSAGAEFIDAVAQRLNGNYGNGPEAGEWTAIRARLGPVHANAPNYVVNLQIVQQNNASTSSIRGLSSHLHSP